MNSLLDLFSISHTSTLVSSSEKKRVDKRIYDECLNNAPYFAYQIEGKKYGVVQGCCNDWLCPRCGQQLAREHYGRIVSGAREIGKTAQLTMLTITCRGKELSVQDAENGYLIWTDKLLTRLRNATNRAHKVWAYASVTERQKREHPHSHYLTTYRPPDAVFVAKGDQKYYASQDAFYPAKHDTLQSVYLERACIDCGLGWQYDISELASIEGASRYVAKYLFKADLFTTKWPKKWRRVRYSNNWPKLPDVKGDAFILLTSLDWFRLSRQALIIKTKDEGVKQYIKHHLNNADVIIQ